ncbi:MAG: histone deacetylase family protein [Pseudomonadota bacterium]
MECFYDNRQIDHAPSRFLVSGTWQPCPEMPDRAEIFLDALKDLALPVTAPDDHGRAPIETVHSRRYVDFLETIHARWQRIDGASPEAIPNVHPVSRAGEAEGGYPRSAVGQVGYHIYDGSAPIGTKTFQSAYWSAQTAIHAAKRIVGGLDRAYALCRPPGHHASRELGGGFCFFSNAAIAANILRGRFDRVAVLDVDVHHGNGTQQVFYDRSDVLTVSIHADPERFYPFFWGYGDEAGSGEGRGYNLNLPLERGTADGVYLETLSAALLRVKQFDPGAVVVALGLDAHESDPFKGLAVTTNGFGSIARRIADLGLPTLIVQEGGYANPALGDNLTAVLSGF